MSAEFFLPGLLIGTVKDFQVRELDSQAQLVAGSGSDETRRRLSCVDRGREMIFFLSFCWLLVFVAQIAEFFIPPLDWMFNAHVYIVPVIVFYGAMALPFPLMLALAFCRWFSAGRDDRAGARRRMLKFPSDGRYCSTRCWRPSCMASGPCLIRGRWEVHCVLSGVCTSAHSPRTISHDFVSARLHLFHREVWWQIGGPGLLAMLMAPLVFWSFHWLARPPLTRISRGASDYE